MLNNNLIKQFVKTKITQSPKVGFTLAEVLITLGIIGVVAAMTIPTLMQKYYEKQTVAKLKETYSILSQALKSASQEEGLPEEWDCNKASKESAEKGAAIFKKYIKVATDCGVDDSKGMCVAPTNYPSLNGREEWSFFKNSPEYKIKLMNGTSFWFRFIDSDTEIVRKRDGMIMSFKIDTNGVAKPNVAGKDLFFLRYYEGKGLLLEGNPSTAESYKVTCLNKNQSGVGCAYYVVTFGNMDYLKK